MNLEAGVYVHISEYVAVDQELAAVRERLERLTSEIQAIVSVLPGLPQGMTPFEYARATAERVDALEAQVERLTEERDRLRDHKKVLRRHWMRAHKRAKSAESEVVRLTEERDELQGRVYVLENLFPEDVRAEIESAEAEVSRLTGLLSKDGQPILNAARSLLRATDNAERNAALGDLYNLLAATPPSVGRIVGGGAK